MMIKIIEKENIKFLNYFKELKELDLSHTNISDIKLLEKIKFEKLEKLPYISIYIDIQNKNLNQI